MATESTAARAAEPPRNGGGRITVRSIVLVRIANLVGLLIPLAFGADPNVRWDATDSSHAQPGTVGFQGAPLCTRVEGGRTFVLPGCRGPGDKGYDPRVDGTVNGLLHPFTGQQFQNELAALSWNFLMGLVGFSLPRFEELGNEASGRIAPRQHHCLAILLVEDGDRSRETVQHNADDARRILGKHPFGTNQWRKAGGGIAVAVCHVTACTVLAVNSPPLCREQRQLVLGLQGFEFLPIPIRRVDSRI